MITRIRIDGFKSFRRIDLALGPLNLFIGTNASGKSNFFDALRVLQGIGNGFAVSEILDGKPRSATNEVWEGIRGGSANACFKGASRQRAFRLTVEGQVPAAGRRKRPTRWEYSITLSPANGRVSQESMKLGSLMVFDSRPADKGDIGDPVLEVRYYRGNPGRQPHLKFERSRPGLRQFELSGKVASRHSQLVTQVADQLADMQKIDPSPAILRGYSQAQLVHRMGERGENFAALVEAICWDEEVKESYLDWLRELRPQEVDDVATVTGAVGEPMFMLRERGRRFPAPILSDGTLRFAAITAAFFQPDMPQIMTIEEIENGVHASRARLLVELIRANAGEPTQVMATTHSPTVLSWLDSDEYATTYFCHRDPDTGETRIQSLPELPHFNDAVADQSVADLFAEGWMEAVS